MAHKPPASSRALCELATELVINILEELDTKTLVFCRQVCRFLKEVVDESIVLRYKIELAIARMEDGPPSNTSVADRRRRLKKYTTAWAELKWESVERIRIVDGDLWELCGGVLGLSCGSSTLIFHRLPGHTRGIEGKKWRIDNVGFHIYNYKMDPSQDLLVMIEATGRNTVNPSIKVHLRTLCTGKPHPLCTNPVIVLPVSAYFNSGRYSSMILSGDNIGIEITYHSTCLKDVIVLNWKSSRIRTWIRESKHMIRSFSFLTDRHLLLAISRDNETRLEVYDMEHTLPTRVEWTGTDYLCAFLYPDAYRSVDTSNVQSDPSPSYSPANDVEVPFYTAQNNRVFSLSMDFEFMPYRFMHFIPSSVLRSRLSGTIEHKKTVFAWEEWGPVETSMMPVPSSVGMVSTYGSRLVYWDFSGMAGAIEAKLLDFNVMARKPQPHVIRCPDVWKHVQTSLPFMDITATLPPEIVSGNGYMNIMISEDNLIFITENDDEVVYNVLTI